MITKNESRLSSRLHKARVSCMRAMLIAGIIAFFAANSALARTEQKRNEIEAESEAFFDRVDRLPSSDLHDLLRFKGKNIYFMAFMNVGAEGVVDGPRYEESSISVLRNYPTISEMNSNYTNSLIFEVSSTMPELAVIAEPFKYPFHKTINWEIVEFEDGTIFNFADPTVGIKLLSITKNGNQGFKFDWEAGPVKQAVRLSGSIDFEFPDDKDILSFSSADLDVWRDLGDMRVRLAEVGKQSVRFEIQTGSGQKPMLNEDDFIIEARDKTGKNLQFLGHQVGSDHEIEVLIKAINLGVDEALAGNIPQKISEAELNRKLAELVSNEKEPTVFTLRVYFNGDIETVDFLFAPKTNRKRIDFDLNAMDLSSPN